jgi:hypothetical protein
MIIKFLDISAEKNITAIHINELYEIGKRFSPAFDTITNGTSVVVVNS